MSVTITDLRFTTLENTNQPTTCPATGYDQTYTLPSGANYRVTNDNKFIAYPTVSQFTNLFPKLIGVGIIWPWQKNLNKILNTLANIAIHNKDPGIICSFSVDLYGNIYAHYVSSLMIEIILWKSEGIYYIEIIIPYDRREGHYYETIRSALGFI